IVKALRIVIGVDDARPERVRLFPRLPDDWNEVAVENYPVVFERGGRTDTARLHYQLNRSGNRMTLAVGADRDLGPVAIRLGPFRSQPSTASVQVNGQPQTGEIERSGGSWWIRFSARVGEARLTVAAETRPL